jgi:hypothetical protein
MKKIYLNVRLLTFNGACFYVPLTCDFMYNRPICGRSTGAYTNLGELQRDLMGVKSHPTKKTCDFP